MSMVDVYNPQIKITSIWVLDARYFMEESEDLCYTENQKIEWETSKGAKTLFAKTYGVTTLGIDGRIIDVEVDVSPGLPGFGVAGLPDTSVKESKERVTVHLA